MNQAVVERFLKLVLGVGTSKGKERMVSLRISDEELKVAYELKEKFGEKSLADVFRTALFIYYGLSVLFDRGGYIEIVEPEEGDEDKPTPAQRAERSTKEKERVGTAS